jgi:hypothetical protein
LNDTVVEILCDSISLLEYGHATAPTNYLFIQVCILNRDSGLRGEQHGDPLVVLRKSVAVLLLG